MYVIISYYFCSQVFIIYRKYSKYNTNKTNNMYKLSTGKTKIKKKYISQGVEKFLRITINEKSAQKASKK